MAHSISKKPGRAVVDLIAVLCILIVVGILVQPILARSRMTPSCACQSNMKQLWHAVRMYTSDYDGALPSSYFYGRSAEWNPDDFIRFAKEQGSLPPSTGLVRQSWPVLLYPYYRDQGYLWCPSDRSRSSSPTTRVSYYWKAAVDRAWYGDPSVGRLYKEGEYAYPGDQILLYERNSWHYAGSSGLEDGAVINCAFMDGHVGAIQIRDSGYAGDEIPAEPLPTSGVGEPAWYNYNIADANPSFDKGQNWNPHIWADRMPEIDSGCDDPATTCQSNLKRLATAMMFYTNDWDNRMPSSYLYGHSSTWNADDFTVFASQRGQLPPTSESGQQTLSMLLYPNITSERILWCPSDDSRSREPSARISYYFKAAADAAWYGGPDGDGTLTRYWNNFAFPADQIIFYERSDWHGHGQSSGLSDGSLINCAFMDGHAGLLTIRDSGYDRREYPAGPLPQSGVGEPAWYNYSYGTTDPAFSKGRNWNPRIWGDKLF